METLTDQVVIVTGASSGIGAALAEAFSEQGARVTLTARRAELLNQTAARVPRGHPDRGGRSGAR